MSDRRIPPPLRGAAALAALVLAAGCVPSLRDPAPDAPRIALPDAFAAPAAATAPGDDPSVGALPWGEFFDAPELRALIETALANNQELDIRFQEILVARNEVSARVGEYLPRLEARARAGIEKVGTFTSQGASDEAHGLPESLKDFGLGLAASWEVDIWRRLRNAARAATYRYLASIEGRNYVVTQLVAELASSYYELVALDSQLEVLQRNIGIQQDALAVVRLEKAAGRVTELAVQRFEAEVLKNQSALYGLQQRIVETQNRINVLVGRTPRDVPRDAGSLRAPLPEVVSAGLPSELLDHRPDVKEASLRLEAAKLDVKSARARFFPALSIEAGVGFEAFNDDHLLDTPESRFFGVAGGLVAPLLNRRAIEAEYRNANAEQTMVVLEYEQVLLRAFTEVTNLVTLISNLQQSYELESRQVELLTRSIDVSSTLFRSARADYMEVLLTRRDALEAEMELIETRLRQRQALVDLYRALGGGWR